MTEKEKSTINYYESHAEEFRKSSLNADMSRSCDKFIELLPERAYILDLGCGTGRDSRYFKEKGYMVLPVDGSSEMCKIAEKTTGEKVLNLRFEDIFFENQFNAVWACASLIHAEREKLPDILRKINRALTEKGILYMSFKYGNGTTEKSGRYFTNMTENDIDYLCSRETGFEVIKSYISEDVRKERTGEKWLNVFARKMQE